MSAGSKRHGVADRLADVAGADFRQWLREDPAALGQMLQASMMEALEAAFAMGMMRGMVMAGRKMRAGQSPSKEDE